MTLIKGQNRISDTRGADRQQSNLDLDSTRCDASKDITHRLREPKSNKGPCPIRDAAQTIIGRVAHRRGIQKIKPFSPAAIYCGKFSGSVKEDPGAGIKSSNGGGAAREKGGGDELIENAGRL